MQWYLLLIVIIDASENSSAADNQQERYVYFIMENLVSRDSGIPTTRETHLEPNLWGPGYAVFIRSIGPNIPLGSAQAVVGIVTNNGIFTEMSQDILDMFGLTAEQVNEDVKCLLENT